MTDALLFVVKVLADLYLYAFLLRFLLQWVRADFHNPLSQFIVRITNPLVLPFRRFIPGFKGLDMATLVVLVLLQTLITAGLLWVYTGSQPGPFTLLYLVVLRTLSMTIRAYVFAMFVYVLMSWINPTHYSPLTSVLGSLCEPILKPVRRVIPPIGGLDLSPLFVLIGLNALLIPLNLPHYLQ
jgi:YggT family protein